MLILFVQLRSLCLRKHRRESKTSFHLRMTERSTYRHLWHGFTVRALRYLLLMFHYSILPVFYGQMHNHLNLQTVFYQLSPDSTLFAFKMRQNVSISMRYRCDMNLSRHSGAANPTADFPVTVADLNTAEHFPSTKPLNTVDNKPVFAQHLPIKKQNPKATN